MFFKNISFIIVAIAPLLYDQHDSQQGYGLRYTSKYCKHYNEAPFHAKLFFPVHLMEIYHSLYH